ncbi:uncharacterized protein LOC111259785 isoform X2 [Varroa jacobsoni]|uniref:uncharacterized protein LOC111259785 isoform X2 n=1 Tax=Varroa jacobsoni TaxID=62625 RepID=UPI000BF45E45|nr:uncharacterized protein LOC111259785 isoform X2 [Varroa jacobsoni]
MSYSRPRFVPRTYHRNYLIGSSLYTDAIIDLNVRRGRPMYYSSSTLPTSPYTYSDRFNASRRGIRLHDDDVYQKTTSRLATRDKLRHHEDMHKAFTGWHSPSYMPLYSIQGYDPARVPFQRRMYLIEPIQLHSQHAAHGRFMENRRVDGIQAQFEQWHLQYHVQYLP